jgi:hypothetical protein
MKARAWVCGLGMALAVASVGAVVGGCAGGQSARFSIGLKAGELPTGQAWEGVYYNPVYGYLHIVGAEGNMTGRWKRTNASAWGEMSGNAEGNVLHFTWTEHKYGEVGPASDSQGSGVFVYRMGDNDIGELDGQYAVKDSDSVGEWHCVKQVGVKPDINSINGDNPMGAPQGDQWK